MRSRRRSWLGGACLVTALILFPADLAEAASAEGGDSWMPVLAKAFNFALLVGLLIYFLRGIVVNYLRSRHQAIREGLTSAAALRASAEQQLADVRAKLAGLPAEVESLKRRGHEELEDERVRMKDATSLAREHLLERTRRDIDIRFRMARRSLIEHTASLSVKLARRRIDETITAEDQVRLIDRYTNEVRP